ncbi:MAG: threonine--tRNA ligase [Thomasclavelia sp.]|jgi:threonyl-tRNA synthetase|nr:threonine--tRNA ligase [Thomasclavelia sp.]
MGFDFKQDENLNTLNHSCAHVMAQAIKHLYPNAKFWVGPVVSEGFYYDVDLGDNVIKDEDIPKIEKEMKKICKDGKRIVRREISKDEALEMFKDDKYKLDLISNLEDGSITCYSQGDFTDLCRGPHVETVKMCKNFKLTKHSGAYWKGDENNKVLQRIYGVCFPTKEELEEYENFMEEAKKRDHKKLGREMELFMLSDYGQGLPFLLPNGYALRRTLENFWLGIHKKHNYKVINTPIMLSKELWETSGHWDHYKEDMFTTNVEDNEYAIKPMNCPGAIIIYKNGLHSYKDLPLRYAELGNVHRAEASGALNGLFRVRGFTQDDAHTFLRPDQIGDEVASILALYDEIYSVFNLDYKIELSTRPDDFIGDIKVWDEAEKALKEACEATGRELKINPGDGAFYGPKLDFKLTDCLNRIWQCGTIQLDMQLPGRFECTYVDSDGEKKTPVMIHRACFGSLERFMGILIEHYAGVFPTWLAPVQVMLLPVKNEYHLDYAKEILEELEENGIRVEMDDREEKLGYRIREAQMKKAPYMLVLGNNERDEKTVTYRLHGAQKATTVSKQEFIDMIKNEIKDKK